MSRELNSEKRMLHSERVALQGLFELDCAEELFLSVIASGEPEAAAAGMRLLLCHMHSWSHSFMSGMVLDRLDAEAATNCHESSGSFPWTNAVQICPNRGL